MKKLIVSDSSANLYRDERSYFTPVPMKIIAGEKEYADDETLDVAGMLDDLQKYSGPSGSSCPSVGDWLRAFGEAEEVFGISITSRLSGCYNAACIAAEEYMSELAGRKVFILDSLTTGPEMELLVEKCRELIEAGYAFDEIKDRITEYLKRTRLLFSLESLSNFARNGRVRPSLAAIANLIGIRIVGRASSEGELEPLHKCRGEKRAIRQLWDSMQQYGYAGGKVRIRHSDNQNAAETLAGEILRNHPDADIKVGTNHGLCSYYAEKGGILVGFETQE